MIKSEDRPAILVVDDVEANLLVLEALLADLDCDVVRASSGNEALRELLRREFAAVLLDVQMPGMDGFEVARVARLDARSREVPIIFVTAMLETKENLFRGYESGAVDVLFKPLNRHMLVSKVTVFLELQRGRRRLSAEIEAHKRTLAELDAFNYTVSHDLRAPLRPISGFSQVLLEEHGDALGEDGRALLEKISGAASRMHRIIDDLLRLARISRAEPDSRPVDLSMVAESIVAEIRSADPEREVEVLVAPNMSTLGDARLLRIALENLLRNAWKFTSKAAHARIEVGVHGEGPGATYFITDNGAGFDPSCKEKLFRAFQRLHSSSDFEGTGIGLAIVLRIIQHHGGRIWAESAPERGATFLFTLA
jgi:signal transduction histidine kinase